MHGHVGSQFERLLEIGRHEGVVYNQVDFFAATDAAYGFDITYRHQRVGWGFDIDHARAFADGTLDVFRVSGVDIGEFETEVCQHLIAEARDAAVKIVSADYVVSGFQHAEDSVDGGHAAGEDFGRG